MGKVLLADCHAADAWVRKNVSVAAPWKVQLDVYIPTATFTALTSQHFSADLVNLIGASGFDGTGLTGNDTSGGSHTFSAGNRNWLTDWTTGNPANTGSAFAPDVWLRSIVVTYDAGGNISFAYAGTTLFTYNEAGVGGPSLATLTAIKVGGEAARHQTGEVYYIDNVKVFNASNTLVFSDDFESGGLAAWDSTSGSVSVVADPNPSPPSIPDGRVLIAWDDAPLEPNPTWTVIDQGTSPFPQHFVSGYDTRSGRQTLTSQTDTGTATVYVNDREGLFDDRNGSSPYQGKLSGRQIMLQLYNPVTAIWEPQFRGLIDNYRYTMDGSAVGADGNPVNASIEIDCVDVFDYLNGYGLTPGLDGVTAPSGSEDSVYYAASGVGDFVGDRILEILTDANIDPTMSVLASGNVQVIETKYNADESALSALRDAADAELPFIANVYVNRSGLFCFRGRYSRFDPDAVAAAGGGSWDFTRWKVGDGKAIQADPTRAQVRLLSYNRDRGDLINAAMCYPQGLAATAIPGQVYADTSSITTYGKHATNPMTDLITANYAGPGTISPDDGKTQCFLYAELLVKNKKDPRLSPTALQLKSINPADFRGSATWDVLTRSDISHIVNVAVGYAGGTGLLGGATVDDYYIEGRALTVRPANSAYDYVELDLEVSPFVWSADTHGVFPPFGS